MSYYFRAIGNKTASCYGEDCNRAADKCASVNSNMHACIMLQLELRYKRINKCLDITMSIGLPFGAEVAGGLPSPRIYAGGCRPSHKSQWPSTTMPQIANDNSITSQTGPPKLSFCFFVCSGQFLVD